MQETDDLARPRVPRWVWILIAVNLLMGAANIVSFTITHLWQLPKTGMFRLSGEANVPTWWSASQLLVIGILLSILAHRLRARRERGAWAMCLPALLFLFLSLDEVASIHEAVGHRWGPESLRTGMWVIFGLPIFLIAVMGVARAVWPFLRGRRDVMRTYMLGLVTLVACAVGLELLANLFPDNSPGVHALVLLEEVGEMTAGTIMLWATVQWVSACGIQVLVAEPRRRLVPPPEMMDDVTAPATAMAQA